MNKMTHEKTYNKSLRRINHKSPRRINHKATKSETNKSHIDMNEDLNVVSNIW